MSMIVFYEFLLLFIFITHGVYRVTRAMEKGRTHEAVSRATLELRSRYERLRSEIQCFKIHGRLSTLALIQRSSWDVYAVTQRSLMRDLTDAIPINAVIWDKRRDLASDSEIITGKLYVLCCPPEPEYNPFNLKG